MGTTTLVSNQSATQKQTGDIHLYLGCHNWLFALEGSPIERIVLPHALDLPAKSGSDSEAYRGVAQFGKRSYAAFDIGRLMGRRVSIKSFVLMEVSFEGTSLPMALGFGPCFGVGRLPETALVPLPEGLAAGRNGAMAKAFVRGRVPTLKRISSTIGIVLRPELLWTPTELACARTDLENLAS